MLHLFVSRSTSAYHIGRAPGSRLRQLAVRSDVPPLARRLPSGVSGACLVFAWHDLAFISYGAWDRMED